MKKNRKLSQKYLVVLWVICGNSYDVAQRKSRSVRRQRQFKQSVGRGTTFHDHLSVAVIARVHFAESKIGMMCGG
jgi:hypothetical protein